MPIRHPGGRRTRTKPKAGRYPAAAVDHHSKQSSKPEPLRFDRTGAVMTACGICGPIATTDPFPTPAELERIRGAAVDHRWKTGHECSEVHPMEPIYRSGETP